MMNLIPARDSGVVMLPVDAPRFSVIDVFTVDPAIYRDDFSDRITPVRRIVQTFRAPSERFLDRKSVV